MRVVFGMCGVVGRGIKFRSHFVRCRCRRGIVLLSVVLRSVNLIKSRREASLEMLLNFECSFWVFEYSFFDFHFFQVHFECVLISLSELLMHY